MPICNVVISLDCHKSAIRKDMNRAYITSFSYTQEELVNLNIEAFFYQSGYLKLHHVIEDGLFQITYYPKKRFLL